MYAIYQAREVLIGVGKNLLEGSAAQYCLTFIPWPFSFSTWRRSLNEGDNKMNPTRWLQLKWCCLHALSI